MENDLKTLGLTWNEIKVYKSLLKLGETAVGGIIGDLKIHRQIAYNALDSLEKRGLVERLIKNKVAHFKVSDPDILVENAQKQELAAKRLSQSIKKEMKKNRRENEINIYNGQAGARNFYRRIFKNVPKGTTVHIMGVSVKGHVQSLGEDFIRGEYNKLKNERKIYSKLVMGRSEEKEEKEFNKKVNPKLRETRYLPYESPSPISTSIWPDRITFMSTKGDIFLIEIINQEFRDSFMDYFKMLWKMAKK